MLKESALAMASGAMDVSGELARNEYDHKLREQQLRQQHQERPSLMPTKLIPKTQDGPSAQELDELERAEATPRTLSSDPLSPRQPIRRTSGRRPLSIISNSSLNSDLSPPSDHRSPDPFSPSRHRRHRSVIGASVDYRHHCPQSYGGGYTNGPYYHNPYGYANPFQCPQTPYQTGGLFGTNHHPSSHLAGLHTSSATSSSGSGTSSGTPPYITPTSAHCGFDPQVFSSHLALQQSLALNSPLSPPPSSSEVPAALSVAAAAAAASNGIQDIFVALAYKERQVLEARQTWEAAKEDLEGFRRQLDSMLAPEPEPLFLPVRPTIISRRVTPNIGIHSLQLTAQSQSTPRKGTPDVSLWRVDWEVPSMAQPADLDELVDYEAIERERLELVEAKQIRRGLAFTVVNCLLGLVHCIISTLPVHQRDLTYRERVYYYPEYPLPMDTLFGHLS